MHLENRSDAPQAPLNAEADADADDGALVITHEGGVLRVAGDVDLNAAPEFKEKASEHVRASAEPRLDMTGVGFLDSAGLAVLVTLVRQAQAEGKTLHLSLTGGPRRVLRITGLDRMMVIDE